MYLFLIGCILDYASLYLFFTIVNIMLILLLIGSNQNIIVHNIYIYLNSNKKRSASMLYWCHIVLNYVLSMLLYLKYVLVFIFQCKNMLIVFESLLKWYKNTFVLLFNQTQTFNPLWIMWYIVLKYLKQHGCYNVGQKWPDVWTHIQTWDIPRIPLFLPFSPFIDNRFNMFYDTK